MNPKTIALLAAKFIGWVRGQFELLPTAILLGVVIAVFLFLIVKLLMTAFAR